MQLEYSKITNGVKWGGLDSLVLNLGGPVSKKSLRSTGLQ